MLLKTMLVVLSALSNLILTGVLTGDVVLAFLLTTLIVVSLFMPHRLDRIISKLDDTEGPVAYGWVSLIVCVSLLWAGFCFWLAVNIISWITGCTVVHLTVALYLFDGLLCHIILYPFIGQHLYENFGWA